MKRRTNRNLSAEEERLWQRVAKTATPLENRSALAKTDKLKKLPLETKSHSPNSKPIPQFEIGATSDTALPRNNLSKGLAQELAQQPVQMDRKKFQKMSRGKSSPEGRLDLHGMTVASAHSALMRFILSSHGEGKRLVLVITGKGRVSDETGPIPTRTGVLKHQVPQWLSMAPLKPVVLQVAQAHQRHGGSGALYVYLRRR